MKTLQELYCEIIKSDELKQSLAKAAEDGKIVEFAKEHGVDTTMDEIKAFLEAQVDDEKELSPEKLENAAGGTCNKVTAYEMFMSKVTYGIACAIVAGISAFSPSSETTSYTYYDEKRKATYKRTLDSESYVGQRDDEDGRLCNRRELPSEDLVG